MRMKSVNKTHFAPAIVLGGLMMAPVSAQATCSCQPGQTQSISAAAHAYAVLPQNTKKSIEKVDLQRYYAPTCWAITDYNVYEQGLGTMGSVSWSSYPPNFDAMNSTQVSNAHQSALDAMLELGYQGEQLIAAEAAINESFSNASTLFYNLNASHSGVEVQAKVSGRGRFTWKGRESAEGTLDVTLTCVPDAFKNPEGMKSLIIDNANLPPAPKPTPGTVTGTIGAVNSDALVKPAIRVRPAVVPGGAVGGAVSKEIQRAPALQLK